MPPKNDYDDSMISETGNWNVADLFAKLKIMKFLKLMDDYEIIATFGSSDLLEELETTNLNTDDIKIRAFKRLVKFLSMLINNTMFALKIKSDKEIFKKFQVKIKSIEKVIPALSYYKKNDLTKVKKLIINQEKYDKIFEEIIKIKAEILEPLNKSDLIFTHQEEFDPSAYKKKAMEDATTRG